MRMTRVMAILVGIAFLLTTAPALAGDTGFKVVLKDENGITINANVRAVHGERVKKCSTSGGACKIFVKRGKWTLSAKTSNGAAAGGPKVVTAVVGKVITVTIVLKKK